MRKTQYIHEASMKILEKTGMRFHHSDALRILKEHGVHVEGEIAYFTEKQVMEWIEKVPQYAEIYAEDEAYNMKIGGVNQYNGPCGGATFIMQKDGTTRPATLDDFIKITKMFEANPAYHLNGGLACQPVDVPAENATEILALTSMMLTRKCLFMAAGDYACIDTLAELACIRFGVTVDELKEKPRFCTIANTNTPLLLDKNMTETILGFGKYRQPVIIASAAMAGTTSPVTLAGTIAMVNAEVLAAIVLAQMANPGTPVIYGSQTSNADLATCAMAIGSPEGALCYKYCAEMAKFYGIPCRGGGSLTDAKTVNVQAGYESMMTCMSCKTNGINIMTQSAGILNSYLAVSYEKLISDFEILNFVDRYVRDIEVNEETIPLDVIDEVGHEGSYLMEEHTIENCRSEFCNPTISVRGPQKNPAEQLEINIDKKMDKLLEAYKGPVIGDDKRDAMRKLMIDKGKNSDIVDTILRL